MSNRRRGLTYDEWLDQVRGLVYADTARLLPTELDLYGEWEAGQDPEEAAAEVKAVWFE